MPKCHDWRNYNGVNYDTPIKRQGDCGSCYAVAMLSAVESRIRVKTKNQEKPFLSNSEAISCNSYNQGCNGGYPYLVAKHGHEVGFSLESCSPYNESDQVCKAECLNPALNTVYKVKEYGYVGRGYYGSTEESSMMQEII
jgi:cathepsin C